MKQIRALALFVVLALGGALCAAAISELALRWLLPRERLLTLLRSQRNPETAVNLPKEVADRLSSTVTHNIAGNVAMAADSHLLFRAKAASPGPNAHCHEGINAEGFRDEQEFTTKSREGTVVVILGDSCLFGLGVCSYANTISPILTKLLHQRGRVATIYNLAQPGYSSEQMKRLAARWLPRLRPHFILLSPGWNDLWDSRLTDREVLSRLEDWPLYLVAVAQNLIYREREGREGRRVPEAETRENLREIGVAANDVRARVILLPLFRAPKTVSWLPDPAPLNQAASEAFGGERWNAPEPEFVHRFTRQAYFRPDGFHPNERGQRAVAEWAAEKIFRLSSAPN